MEADPVVADAWHIGIVMFESMQPVTGMFPFRSMLDQESAEKECAFVVDIGSESGNALVVTKCGSSVAGRIVLQDMTEVLESTSPVRIKGVQIMPHNFYNPQPVRSKCLVGCSSSILLTDGVI
jgi:hypothetical protein